MSLFKQLGRSFKRFGRQLSGDTIRLGRQLHSGLKLMPQAFKDTSKIYSDLEQKTKGVPIVPSIFKTASLGTQTIGDLLSGNLGKALAGGKQTIASGQDTFGKTAQVAEKLAPLIL